MNLQIRRYEQSRDGRATIGKWYVDGEYLCFNLEDAFREPSPRPASVHNMDDWVKGWKIPGKTAIPSGIYKVVIDRSPLFSQRATQRAGFHLDIYTPHILDVHGYAGIRIHPGNKVEDTEGCQCPGLTHVLGASTIGDSRKAMELLLPRIEYALGLERVPAPDQRIAMYLRHWAYSYNEVRKAEDVWLTITNEFSSNPPLGVEGFDQ